MTEQQIRTEDLERKKQEADAIVQAQTASLKEQDERTMADIAEREKLAEAQQAEQDALAAHNKQQYSNVGQIVSDIQTRIDSAKTKDEALNKRANAFRYISGVGDTLSAFANLVGTANGASNQQQTYNSNVIAQKAEQARRERKIEMDDLNKRLDEMTARQRDLQAAGSLKEAELKAKHNREAIQMASAQRKAADEADRLARREAYSAGRDARQDFNADRSFQAQQSQFNRSMALRARELEASLAEKNENKSFPITISGRKYEIPKRELNDAQVGNIFSKLPDDVKAAVRGKAYTEKTYDEDGMERTETKYEAPSLAQKIAAITEYAEKTGDETIIKEIEGLAGYAASESGDSPKATETPAAPMVGSKTGTDWSGYSSKPAAASGDDEDGGEFYMNETHKARMQRKKLRKENISSAIQE